MAKKKSDPESNGHVETPTLPAPDPQPEAPREAYPQVPATEAPPPESRSNLPVHTIRFGTVRACIWCQQTDYGPRHNVTVSRLYKGQDNNWYSSSTFGYRDLLALAKCLDWAHSWIAQEIANQDVPF
jgi:hypothetical protein